MTEPSNAPLFGAWLVALRKERDLTQKELADAVGCSHAAIQKFEAGTRRPSKAMAERMAAILDIPAHDRAAFMQSARKVAAADADVTHLPAVTETHDHTASGSLSHKAAWGEAPDISRFYGREGEMEQLRRWLTDERCKLVAVLGIGGMGKTTLVTCAAALVQEQFSTVLWRSLRNAPPVAELVGHIITLLADGGEQELPDSFDQRLSILMEHLREWRCLLVFDNFETVLASDRPGHYLAGFEGYGQVLKQIGEGRHQSCLLVTSREKPKELIPLVGDGGPVRALLLHSLDLAAGRALLRDRGLQGSEQHWAALHARYSGNPLALQIAAETIRELFAGDIALFLQEDAFFFGGISDLLAQQRDRLSPLELEVVFWLAVEREPVTAETLVQDLVERPSRLEVLAALHNLRQRFLVERVQEGFTLQNVVLEYFTAALVQQICTEVRSLNVDYLRRFALLKSSAASHVEESQRTLLLGAVAGRLLAELGREAVAAQVRVVLGNLRRSQLHQSGYAGGNILNVMVHLGLDLQDQDFSNLAVWQADLRNVTAHGMNLRAADLAHTAFTDTFAGITSLAFSPDGQRLAAGTTGSEIRLWQVSDTQPLLAWFAHTGWVRSVGFSPEGNLLASGGGDGAVRIWDAHNGRSVATLRGHTNEVMSVCFSPDGSLLASGSIDQTVRIWDRDSGHCLQVLEGHAGDINSVCFCPNGNLIASGSADKTVRIWDGHTGKCLRVLSAHADWVWCISFDLSCRLLASASADHTVRLWDWQTGRCLHILQGHTGTVRSISFGADGNILASGSYDQTVQLWDVQTGNHLRKLAGHKSTIWSVCFGPDHNLLASGGFDQAMRLWDPDTGRCLRTVEGYTGWLWSVCVSPDGGQIAAGSIDRTVQLWDRYNGRPLRPLDGHTGSVHSVCFSPDGQLLASGSFDRTVRLWDRSTGRCLCTLDEHTGWVWSVCFSPDSNLLASGSDDQTVRIWDRQSGQCVKVLQGHTGSVRFVCFSADGSRLASGSEDQAIRIWDVDTGHCLHTIEGQAGSVRSICFSPDGTHLVSCARDQVVRMWDSQSGECVRTFEGHTGWVWSVCLSPDGSTLASVSGDQTVRLWRVQDSMPMAILQGHTNDVMSVCFTPDGTELVSGSGDETIRLWELETGLCLSVLHSDRPYEGMDITGATGLTSARAAALKRLGAVEG